MRVLLVDDEAVALDRLRVFFADIGGVEVVGEARDGDELSEAIERLRPDLVVLDIQMPRLNGLRAAAQLSVEPKPDIVFVTAHEHYAPDAFEVDAADYLLKPVRLDRLRLALDRARRRQELREQAGRMAELEAENAALRTRGEPTVANAGGHQDHIWIVDTRGSVRVPVSSVEWIEAAKDYVLLHTPTRSHMLRATMAALEDRLDPEQLLRVHRSFFLRPSAVVELRRAGRSAEAVLASGAVVQVSLSYQQELETRLGLSG